MGTNYYLLTDKPTGVEKDEEGDRGIHLGKSSGGWAFTVRARLGVATNWDTWSALVRIGVVVSEYGAEQPPEEFLTWVLGTRRDGRLGKVWPGQFTDNGLRFDTHPFC